MTPNETHSLSFPSLRAKAKQSRAQHDATSRSRIDQGRDTGCLKKKVSVFIEVVSKDLKEVQSAGKDFIF
ncbi:MAG: hypothetical protein RRY07_09640 [Bacteroidaceae bacterium]